MAVAAFDTHAFIKRLQQAGISEAQAEVFSDAFQEAQEALLKGLVTKSDLASELAPIKAELHIIKWALGIIATGIVGLLFMVFRILMVLPGT